MQPTTITGLPSPGWVPDEAQMLSRRQSSSGPAPRFIGKFGTGGAVGRSYRTGSRQRVRSTAAGAEVRGTQFAQRQGGVAHTLQHITLPSSVPRTGPYAVSATG